MARLDTREIEEDLDDLEHKLQRLRIEYDQYFAGSGRREPTQLRSDVQKTITRYSSDPPRNTQLKFKMNRHWKYRGVTTLSCRHKWHVFGTSRNVQGGAL
jgi:hypothetical protein